MRFTTLAILTILFSTAIQAQDYELKSTTQVYRDLQKLERGMRVLYIAAHPDDENTRLISWLENDQYIETAYLSLTRGQGGQNLIGDEKGDALGVIRTYELLEARKLDGGEQFFTRAVDFGYSKSAEESFEKWGKEEVLADVVYVIRKFRPHVIITRFPPDRNAGHGHHEASALLAAEAFDLAGNPEAFPEQLKFLEAWSPEAMYFNSSSWWRKELDDKTTEGLISEKIHRLNIGVFDPLTGLGINETAGLARSKHRCQAFGTWRDRGERFEYLQQLKGEWKDDLFASMDGVWSLSKGHKEALDQMISEYDFTNPEKNLVSLNTHFLPKISQRNIWTQPMDMKYVMNMVASMQQNMMGMRIEAFADESPIVVGADYTIHLQVYNAGKILRTVRFDDADIDTTLEIGAGKQVEFNRTFKAPTEPSTPFWLRLPHGNLYEINDYNVLGLPKLSDRMIQYTIKGDGVVKGETELHRKWNDRSIGEVIQPMWFVPQVSITNSTKSILVKKGASSTYTATFKAFSDVEFESISGSLYDLTSKKISLKKGQQETLTVPISAAITVTMVAINSEAKLADVNLNQTVRTLNYDHIPKISILEPAAIMIVPLELPVISGKILYIEGSGDEVDESLELIGYQVDRKSLSGVTSKEMQAYEAVIIGIRAYNTNDELPAYQGKLMEYVKAGGNVIVQYNTSYGMKLEQIGPYPLTLGRERVTEEDAKPTFVYADHAVFNRPNKISMADFDGWVQERGLYFASKWDEAYAPLIAWSDKGEEPVNGGLLCAKYGEGSFFYTGISFFRELPAGVPGAYRLFVNMIEYKP